MMTTSTEKRFFGHPRQLGTLFYIEMWERFAFYGGQSLLMIYLYYKASQGGGLGMEQSLAAGLVGVYGGSIYLTTIVGGWLADRVIGPKNTLFFAWWYRPPRIAARLCQLGWLAIHLFG